MATVPQLPRHARRQLLRIGRKSGDTATALRFQAVAKLATGLRKSEVARALDLAVSTVIKAAQRFAEHGLAGLLDQRRNNGSHKIDDAFRSALVDLLRESPQNFGWRRPTWTRELLCKELHRRGLVRVAVCTIGRLLRRIGARLGSPRPTVRCPWPQEQRERVLRRIHRIEQRASGEEPVYFCDEVDIHLNPRIGRDWMLRGTQRLVRTPGNNEKHYLAGALNTVTRELVWAHAPRKTSDLFCALLSELARRHVTARAIHLILDNFSIHQSRRTVAFLRRYGELFKLHFLPPYCPSANRIEREWQELHAMVTRNHRCPDMPTLLQSVHHHLRQRNRLALHERVFGKSATSRIFANYDR